MPRRLFSCYFQRYKNARAAASGYGKVGIPARFRMASPAATSAPPIQLARIGLPFRSANGFNASAVCVGSVTACGVSTTRRPSLFSSFAAIATALAYRSGPASPRISIGLPWLQCAGKNVELLDTLVRKRREFTIQRNQAIRRKHFRSSRVSDDSEPRTLRAWLPPNHFRHSNRSEMRLTRSTPTRRNAAFSTSSLPDRDPVWDAAALLAASV